MTDNSNYMASCRNVTSEEKMYTWDKISEIEVEVLVDMMDLSKNSNIDGISAFLLKECILCSLKEVTFLFNCVLEQGKFPDNWKLATVVPLFKGGDRQITSNYRPISLLSAIGKLMEKLIHKRVLRYLDDNKFFTDCQGGFRPNLGTTETIDKFLDYIYNNINNNHIILTIYFDLKKAFDTVNHKLLLAKIEGAGISGICLELLSNYLSNRFQRCRIHNNLSEFKSIKYGVPQGSTLGPLLFIIFINDLVKFVNVPRITLYADDTAFLAGSNDLKELCNTIQIASNEFHHWCQLNRLTLNLSKTKVMLFSNKPNKMHARLKKEICISIDGVRLDIVNEFKYLGMILDEKLTYTSHIKMLKQHITGRMFTLKKVRWVLNFRESMLLFKSSILCYFDQGSLFYHSATVHDLKQMQVLQNKCLRIIYSKKNWDNTENAHKSNNILTCHNRRILFLLKRAHVLAFTPGNLKDHSIRSLRSMRKLLLKEPRCHNCKFEKSYISTGIKLWNCLTEDIKSIRNLENFKTRVNLELL